MIFAGVLSVLLLLLITGCAAEPTPTPRPAQAGSPTFSTSEQAFIRGISDTTAAGDPADDLRRGRDLCSALDAGATFDQAAQALVTAGYSDREAGTFIGAATGALCPQHGDVMTDRLSERLGAGRG